MVVLLFHCSFLLMTFVPIFSFSAFGQLFISPASGALFSPFPFTCFFAHLASFLTVKRVSFRSRLSISSFPSMEHASLTGDNTLSNPLSLFVYASLSAFLFSYFILLSFIVLFSSQVWKCKSTNYLAVDILSRSKKISFLLILKSLTNFN